MQVAGWTRFTAMQNHYNLVYREEEREMIPLGQDQGAGVIPQIALAWLLSKPAVSAPIVGATKLRHLEDAIAAVDLTLGDEEVARLEAPYRPHPVIGHS